MQQLPRRLQSEPLRDLGARADVEIDVADPQPMLDAREVTRQQAARSQCSANVLSMSTTCISRGYIAHGCNKVTESLCGQRKRRRRWRGLFGVTSGFVSQISNIELRGGPVYLTRLVAELHQAGLSEPRSCLGPRSVSTQLMHATQARSLSSLALLNTLAERKSSVDLLKGMPPWGGWT
jgi:hypothetical protein